uniref:Trialysin n=1 Tax=Triatoma matogrossensis TaxID=162370 RepID=E2J777_9HEMI
MSKIWLLLLLVAVIQYARAYPALEAGEEKGVTNFLSYDFLEDWTDEERGKVGDWLKDRWSKLKSKMKKVGANIKASFNRGREYLKKKGIKVDPLSCEGTTCKSCVILTIEKKKFCIEFGFSSTTLEITLTRQKDEQESEAIFPSIKINLGNVPTYMKLGDFLGKLCLQGVEGRIKSSEGKPNINICLATLLKKWSVGAKLCILIEDGKIDWKFKPKLFAGEEDDGNILEAGEKEDEGKPVDPVPE